MAKDRNDQQQPEKKGRKSPYDELEEYEEDFEDEEELEQDDAPAGGFLSTTSGKIIAAIIAVFSLVLIGLLVFRFFFYQGGADGAKSPSLPPAQTAEPVRAGTVTFATAEPKDEGPLTFGPATEMPVFAGDPSTPKPEATSAPTPTPTPKPTDSPLPIILTNTPTPTPSPTPTVEPTPSPTPSPSPVPMLGTGKTKKDENILRDSPSAGGKVKKKVKKGKAVTIHDIQKDKKGSTWYAVTVDSLEVTGWMRDYLIALDGEIEKTEEPEATPDPKAVASTMTASATSEPEAKSIAKGKANHDANLRKIMNGSVLMQLRKGRKVNILSVRTDKSGKIWYEVQPENSQKVGFVRENLITVNKEDQDAIAELTGAKAEAEEEPAPEETEKVSAEETPAPTAEPEIETIGTAKTKNDTNNVRVKPSAKAKIVRALSKGIELDVFEKFEADGAVWYEVATKSGKTRGFIRDYLLVTVGIPDDYEAKAYEP